jgi:hypothetical protein
LTITTAWTHRDAESGVWRRLYGAAGSSLPGPKPTGHGPAPFVRVSQNCAGTIPAPIPWAYWHRARKRSFFLNLELMNSCVTSVVCVGRGLGSIISLEGSSRHPIKRATGPKQGTLGRVVVPPNMSQSNPAGDWKHSFWPGQPVMPSPAPLCWGGPNRAMTLGKIGETLKG